MSRSPIHLILALFAVALIAVPTAFAKGRDDRSVRIQGVCTQKSTSKLKLSREDRGIEVEFEVDQNRDGVPWRVTLRRNGNVVASLTAKTRAPSGSFEIRRVVVGRLGSDRITAVATTSRGETCAADSVGAPKAKAVPAGVIADDTTRHKGPGVGDDRGHDAGDDHGHHSGGHF